MEMIVAKQFFEKYSTLNVFLKAAFSWINVFLTLMLLLPNLANTK